MQMLYLLMEVYPYYPVQSLETTDGVIAHKRTTEYDRQTAKRMA
jgi:hypothetical protein